MQSRTGKVLFCYVGITTVALMLLFDGDGVFSHSGRTDSSGGHPYEPYSALEIPTPPSDSLRRYGTGAESNHSKLIDDLIRCLTNRLYSERQK